ncbi:MAG: DUF1217 domain-containing protein [Pseudomonadota bacterium]
MVFTPLIAGSGLSALNFLETTRSDQEARLRADPSARSDIEAVRARLTSVETADELLGDRQLLRVALTAFGLQDDIDKGAFLKRILESDIADRSSFANRLADRRYTEFAQAFNFGGDGGAQLPQSSPKDAIAPLLRGLPDVDSLFTRRNEPLLERALEVFDLQRDASQPDFLKRVLESDVSDPNALVNRLDDPRYVEFASALQPNRVGAPEAVLERVSEFVADRLQSVETSSDLLEDPLLLQRVLRAFGAEQFASNPLLVGQVLDSDLSDPASLANTLGDPALLEIARAFDFANRKGERESVYRLAEIFDARPASFETVDGFLADEELVSLSRAVFGLTEDVVADSALRDILLSDTADAASPANVSGDARQIAFAKAFDFDPVTGQAGAPTTSPIAAFAQSAGALLNSPSTAEEFFDNANLTINTLRLLDLPRDVIGLEFAQRVLSAQPDDPLSVIGSISDTRYATLQSALNFSFTPPENRFPPGFAEAIIDDYIANAFEISVGEQNVDLRLGLSLQTGLENVVRQVRSNDARWFQILGTGPLRTVVARALGVPDASAAIDVDKQVEIFKDRAVRTFGTDEVAEFLEPERLDQIRTLFALGTTRDSGSFGATAATTPILSLLA